MIHLDLHLAADHPDELAEAFQYLLERGIALEQVGTEFTEATGNVVSLDHRRTAPRHA